MNKRWSWLLLPAIVILLANFWILMLYGDTLRSTHLFIVRGTVFYPMAYLNLIIGLLLTAFLIYGIIRKNP